MRSRLLPALGLAPFLIYVGIFLVVPTINVVVGAFQSDSGFTFDNLAVLGDETTLRALWRSVLISGTTAVLGAVVGAMLAWAISSLPPTHLVRRIVVSAMGVLAQFGGVTLAFAFIATFGFAGVVTEAIARFGVETTGSSWLYGTPGLILVYTYFQIPLMVIVFFPAIDGIRPQWREAASSLGASAPQYFFEVVVPLLRPAFLGSLLLLFANAFASYATAAALVTQGAPILPLMIRAGLTSEIVLGRENVAFAIALEMVVVVSLVMAAYALLVRRSSRWLQ